MEIQTIQSRIYEIRGQKVMLDFDLAALYEVETRALKQAVRRNADRFPEDFMFALTKSEWQELITVCDNLPDTVKFSPANPFAFTEQGVAMLSSVLKSKKAVAVNISIIRAFVMLRQFALTYSELAEKITKLEGRYDKQFADVYEAINLLLQEKQEEIEAKERKRIGFKN